MHRGDCTADVDPVVNEFVAAQAGQELLHLGVVVRQSGRKQQQPPPPPQAAYASVAEWLQAIKLQVSHAALYEEGEDITWLQRARRWR